MPCYNPLKAWVHSDVNPKTGRHKIVFTPDSDCLPKPISVACGQCFGCRLERSRQWAIRCVHEASLYDHNCFITLTYSDQFLPPNGSLVKSAFQKFMKRLRKRFGSGVRYYQCGEYGADLGRPHYHACLFNFDFPDKKIFTIKNGNRLYCSDILTELWPFGFSLIGDVSFESAAYVARYVLKKKFGGKRYQDLLDSFYKGKVLEYTTMSRRPGIGLGWFDQFKSDVFPEGLITLRGGIKCRVPKYYEAKFELTNAEILDILKCERESKAMLSIDNTPERLKVRETIARAKVNMLQRGLECS